MHPKCGTFPISMKKAITISISKEFDKKKHGWSRLKFINLGLK